jgi:hypothetical protein
LATRTKATKVAADLDLLTRRQLVLHPRANEGIDPIDATGFRNRAISPYGDTARTP